MPKVLAVFQSLPGKPDVLLLLKQLIIKMAGRLLMLLEAAASIEGMCCEVFYIALKMILRHLPK